MRNISKIVVAICAISNVAFCDTQESFFMSDSDSKKAILLAKQYGKSDSNEDTNFKVSGIFFIDEMNWTIWLNGAPYSEAGQHGNFSIDEGSENEVIVTTSSGETFALSVE